MGKIGRPKKKFDDFGREISPEESEKSEVTAEEHPKKRKGRGKTPENIRKEKKAAYRMSHGIVLSCDVKKIFKDVPEPGNAIGGYELKVVKWSTAPKAVFEKRKYWVRQRDKMKVNRQLMGITAEDIRFIADNADAIIAEIEKANEEARIEAEKKAEEEKKNAEQSAAQN